MASADCKTVMCEAGLTNKKESTAWLLKHHPDRGGEPTDIDVGAVAACMGKKEFCGGSPKADTQPATPSPVAVPGEGSSIRRVMEKVKRRTGTRDSAPEQKEAAYKPNNRQLECVRQVSNWSKIVPSNRFNKSRFSIAETDKLIPIASPKLEAMLQNIEALDKNDQTVSGKTYKHFIFSDIKFLGYGAKIISAGMIARGFKPIIRHEKSRIVVDVPESEGKNFAVLSSTALWDSPFKHKLKKEVLDVYNARPDNIYGERCRFIVLDSGFKEGIDLFDVKYVHLFEPLMTAADMTQALGRATRLCGQKGLEFVPNQGWPLHVFKYSQNIPESLTGLYNASTLFEIALQLKGLDPNLHHISKAIQDVSILAAVDQPLTEEIHKSGIIPKLRIGKKTEIVTEVVSTPMTAAETRANLLENKAATRLALEDEKMLSLEDENIEDLESLDPCGPQPGCHGTIVPFQPSRLRSETVVPTVVSEVSTIVVSPPPASERVVTTKRDSQPVPTTWFELRTYVMSKFKKMAWGKQEVVNKCGAVKGGAVQTRAGAAALAAEAAAAAKERDVRVAEARAKREAAARAAAAEEARGRVTASARRRAEAARAAEAEASERRRRLTASARRAAARKTKKRVVPKKKTTRKAPAKKKAPTKKSTTKKAAAAKPAPVVKEKIRRPFDPNKKYPSLRLIDYTPTQDFISSYFTIESPIKGMLLWHSVGTGKTCTAIALASRQFEPAGFTIMWVTRHTLKADIWKNIFDQVCHATIAEEVRRGELEPQDIEARQRSLYQQWIPPVSYRQFSNIVQGKNPVYKQLVERNGKADPLKKTLIIIDEAHKLYSADFKGAEKPDVPAFMAALQNSYATSGKDSARVLLMTATPYNESPMELMALLNLCREKSRALPTELPEFVEKYMDGAGSFTVSGLKTYMNDIAGQISYLNREADPSQFAQPIFADVVVPISTLDSVAEGDGSDVLVLRKDIADLMEEQRVLRDETIPYLEHQIELIEPAEKAKEESCRTQFVGKPKDTKACLKRVATTYKAARKLEERNLREARKRAEKITPEIEKLGKKIKTRTAKAAKTGLGSMTQEAQLATRCKIGVPPK